MTNEIALKRVQSGLSQKRLAELAHVSQPNLSAYESGKRIPRPETLERIMAALRRRPSEILAEHRGETLEAARRHKAGNVRVFGSAVRGEDTPGSDLDLLVDLEPGATLFDLAGLRLDLVDLLGVDVDIVPSGSTGSVMDRILGEAVPL
ncbi:helix-turn-helix domain-containing protein [Pseudarthrobacter albicanus]|uniref:helix-turn-helix domain-containing protein n=1 Tax=Pseudarthrobacter albicanus TaxID=2823873 RepID=UPI001BAB700E|nr:helix-turn-helix domain-containing protein [Pseudarthrobacter albicanus]